MNQSLFPYVGIGHWLSAQVCRLWLRDGNDSPEAGPHLHGCRPLAVSGCPDALC